MPTYIIELTKDEHLALLHMIEKGWLFMKNNYYFYNKEELEQQCIAAWHKANKPHKN